MADATNIVPRRFFISFDAFAPSSPKGIINTSLRLRRSEEFGGVYTRLSSSIM